MAQTQGTGPLGDKEPDLTDRAMAGIDQLVDTIHDRVIRPILLVGRSVAFSFIIVFAVAVVAVAVGVGLMRLLNSYFFGARPWISWALLGAISLVGGLVIWRRRTAVPTREPSSR